jgi:hypothetical protein
VDPDPYPDPDWAKFLDPDPDWINPDPQPLIIYSALTRVGVSGCLATSIAYVTSCATRVPRTGPAPTPALTWARAVVLPLLPWPNATGQLPVSTDQTGQTSFHCCGSEIIIWFLDQDPTYPSFSDQDSSYKISLNFIFYVQEFGWPKTLISALTPIVQLLSGAYQSHPGGQRQTD